MQERSDYIEVNILTTLKTEPDQKGKSKIIKKDIQTKMSLYIDDIEGHEEVFTEKGIVMKSFCRIYHKTIGQVVINKSYKALNELINKQINYKGNKIGFK